MKIIQNNFTKAHLFVFLRHLARLHRADLLDWCWDGVGGLPVLDGADFFAIVNRPVRLAGFLAPKLAVKLLHVGCGSRRAK